LIENIQCINIKAKTKLYSPCIALYPHLAFFIYTESSCSHIRTLDIKWFVKLHPFDLLFISFKFLSSQSSMELPISRTSKSLRFPMALGKSLKTGEAPSSKCVPRNHLGYQAVAISTFCSMVRMYTHPHYPNIH